MSRRNVWLSFEEWKLINDELSDQEWHSFRMTDYQLKEWKKEIEYYKNLRCEYSHCFNRVGVYPEITQVKSAKAYNVLCREDWRSQDMWDMMRQPVCFVGFIINHVDDVNMNTTKEQWEDIRIQMIDEIDKSGQNIWISIELIELYKKVTQLVAA
jgi:hypothetical protein